MAWRGEILVFLRFLRVGVRSAMQARLGALQVGLISLKTSLETEDF